MCKMHKSFFDPVAFAIFNPGFCTGCAYPLKEKDAAECGILENLVNLAHVVGYAVLDEVHRLGHFRNRRAANLHYRLVGGGQNSLAGAVCAISSGAIKRPFVPAWRQGS